MMLGWCLVYLLVIVLLGYALTWLICRKSPRSLVEQIGLSIVLGAGAMGTILLWLSMLGMVPGRASILIVGFLAAGLVIASFVMRASPPRLRVEHGQDAHATLVICILPILGLLAANLLALIPAMGMPSFEWDSFVIWGLKAKVLYQFALRPLPDYFTNPAFSYSHVDYPLLLPMLTAGAYAMIGQVDEQLGKICLPILFAGQTLLAYVGARIWLNRLPALVVALLLIGAPFNIQFAGVGTADMALTTFRLASVIYLIRWIKQGEKLVGSASADRLPDSELDNRSAKADPTADLVLCALFTVLATLTKSEGLPLAGINLLLIVAFCIRNRAWKQLIVCTTMLTIGIGSWLIFRSALPHTDESYFSRMNAVHIFNGISRIGPILGSMLSAFADFRNWGFLWMILPILALIGFRSFGKPATICLWILLLSHLALYMLIFMITPWNLDELLPVTVPRLLLHVSPTAMLLVAAHGGEILRVARAPAESV